jgi:hypothetical protein
MLFSTNKSFEGGNVAVAATVAGWSEARTVGVVGSEDGPQDVSAITRTINKIRFIENLQRVTGNV